MTPALTGVRDLVCGVLLVLLGAVWASGNLLYALAAPSPASLFEQLRVPAGHDGRSENGPEPSVRLGHAGMSVMSSANLGPLLDEVVIEGTGTETTGTETTGTETTGTETTGTETTGTETTGTETTGTETTGTETTGTETTGTETLDSGITGVQLLATITPPPATENADSFAITANGDGTFSVTGTSGALAAGDTISIDGLGGLDSITAADVPGVWTITGIDSGTYQIENGPTIEFTHVENLVGALTSDEQYIFDEHAGLTGGVDDGTGQLTVGVGGFVTVTGDYVFVVEDREVVVVPSTETGGAPATKSAKVIKVGGTATSTGTGRVGITVENETLAVDEFVGLEGTLTDFLLAVVTELAPAPETEAQAWHVFSGTMSSPTFVAPADIDLDLQLDSLTVSVNTTSEDGSWLDLSSAPITISSTELPTPPSTSLAFADQLVSATAPVVIDLGGFLYVAGNLTLTKGGPTVVNVNTGLQGVDEADIPEGLKDTEAVGVSDTDPTDGSLARTEDYGTLWNVKVSALQLAFTGATAFVGAGFETATDTDGSGAIDAAEAEAAGAIGLLAGGVNLAFVLLTPLGAMPISTRFLGVTGTVESFSLIGFGDFFSLNLAGIQIAANTGSSLVSGGGTPSAVVDWVSSFPGITDNTTTVELDESVPAGYHVFIGGTDPPELVIDSTDAVIGVSAERAVLSISSFVHIGGRFSLEQGATQRVDVEIEDLDEVDLRSDITNNTATEDPTDGSLATNDDGSMIWNLPVSTMLLGISDASVFVGYNPGGFDPAVELPFDAEDLADGAIGLLATGISMGLVLATPLSGSFASANKLPSFLAVRADITSFTFPGLPEEIDFALQGVRVEVNRGGVVTGDADSYASVDWAASFPDDESPGISIPTGGPAVVIGFEDPVIALRADRAILSISDFVHISGGFSMEFGGDEEVTVNTGGLSEAQGSALGGATTATGVTISEDGATITGLPVTTLLIGISNANFFVGYNPDHEPGSSFELDEEGDLVLSDDAIGLVATGIDAGFALATPDRGAITGYTLPTFFAMHASVNDLAVVGIPDDEVVFTFEDVNLDVNRGGVIRQGAVPLSQNPTGPPTSLAWIDWEASFPDTNGATTEPLAGLEVPTGTTTDPVYIGFADPILGVSAGKVTLAISDFVFIQGGFAFQQGARELIDVRTFGLSGAGTALATAINGTEGNTATDPEGDDTRASAGAAQIWDLPVITTLFGIADAAIFVGYNPNYAPGTSFDVDGDGDLVLSEDAVGFAARNIDIGMVFAAAEPGAVSGYAFGTFWAISAFIGEIEILGLPDELDFDFEGIHLSVNSGGAVRTGTAPGAPILNSKAVVDWASSFPDTDGADNPLTTVVEGGDGRGGLEIPTGEGNDPVYVDFHGPVVGISASLVTIAVSDFVYIRGGFAFELGGRENVDVRTSGLTTGATLAAALNAGSDCLTGGCDEDPDGTDTRANSDASIIWDVPVVTNLIGISDASIFVGYNPNEAGTSGTSFDAGEDGILDDTDLSGDAIGLLANNIDVGLVLATLPVDAHTQLRTTFKLPSFLALRATVGLLTPIGLPDDLVFRFEGIGLSVNNGGQVGAFVNSNAWVDWGLSFPEILNEAEEEGEEATVAKPAGFLVPTGVGNTSVLVDFAAPIIGVEAERVVISILEFVHISGGFAFQKGAIHTVDIKTGLNNLNAGELATCTQLAAAVAASTGGESLNTTCESSAEIHDIVLQGAQVQTIELGIHDASIFVGYNPSPECPAEPGPEGCPVFDTGEDGILQQTELSPAAVGFLAGGINLGMVLADFVPGSFTTAHQTAGGGKPPSFFALKAHVDELMLVGIDALEVTALDATVEVNLGNKWTTASNALSPPVIDWKSSFAAVEDNPDTESVDETKPAGLAVATGGSNPPVYIDYDGYLIGGGVSRFTLRISDFVYVTGSVYFEYGPVREMPLADGIIESSLVSSLAATLPDTLGDLEDYTGICTPTAPETDCTATKQLQFLTIGAQDVQAFVGQNFWIDANGNGKVDLDDDGTIVDAELNPDRVGLELTDLDFALALMTPVLRLDPVRYLSLHASAGSIELVGVDGLTASATDIVVELNISTPTFQGLPVLPVIDWQAYAERDCVEGETCTPDPFGVKVAAPDTANGEPVTFDFLFDGPLIRASVADINLNVFGLLAVRGSVAFVLGPRYDDLTLTDDSQVDGVVTMTLGGANLLGFVGYVPDNGTAWQLDENGDVRWADGCVPSGTVDCEIVKNPDAVGLLINDLDFGLFVGVKTPSTEDPSGAVYVAADISIEEFGLIGAPGITAMGTLALMVNLGLTLGASNSVAGINFKESFDDDADPDGDDESDPDACTATNTASDQDQDCDNVDGFALDTGNPATPMILDFETTFLSAQLAGVLNIVDFVQALGVFYLEADDQGLKLLVNAQLLIGSDKVTSPTPGMVDGNHATGVDPLLQIGALGVLIINGDGVAADLDVDLALNVPGVTLTASARILFNSTGAPQALEVPKRLLEFLTEQSTTNSLAADLLSRLVGCPGAPAEEGDRCYTIDGTAPDLTDEDTVRNLLHNPTGDILTSGSAGAYVVVVIDGSFDFLGFATGSGLAGIRVSEDVFQLIFELDFSIGIDGAGLDFRASGELEIVPEGFSVELAVSLDADVTSLFHLDVTGTLSIKSYGPDAHFKLFLSGRLDVLSIFSVSGTLNVVVADNAWEVSVSASGQFGPVEISGSGTIRSDGTFDLSFSAGFQIGPDVVHVSASISLRIYMENVRSDGVTVCNADNTSIPDCGITEGGKLRFGFELVGDAEACAFGICLGVEIGVLIDGVISGNPDEESFLTVTVHACVDLLFDDACADIDVATIRLPGSIFPEGDPKLGEMQGSVLVLNVGDRGGERLVQRTATVEDFQLVQLSSATDGTFTVQVLAFGRSQVFEGVTLVTGDFGSENDSLVVVNGQVPVTASGGDGDDTLSNQGSGRAEFTGGNGHDMLVGGSGPDSLDGGLGNDYIEGRGGVDTLVGGPSSPLAGTTDDDTFVALIADAFSESPQAGSGSDTYEIIGTTGNDTFTVTTAGSNLSVVYTGSLSGTLSLAAFEHLVLQAGTGADHFTISGDFGPTGLVDLTLGLTELEDLSVADTVVLNLTGAADTLSLGGGSTSQVFTLARGVGSVISYPAPAGGSVALTTGTWNGTSTIRLVGSGLADADLLTINALAGDDELSVRGNSANTVLDAGDGDDLVAVGSNAGGTSNSGGILDGVDGSLIVSGGAGSDTMTVDDSGDTSGDTDGHLTGTQLTGLGLSTSGLTYGDLEFMTITLGSGDDTFNIDSTNDGTDTTVHANGGNDAVNVNDTQGTTTVHGDAGTDTIAVHDTHGWLTVNGDAGADTVTVNDAHAVLTVNGGDEADTVTVNDTHGTSTINGAAGADDVLILAIHAPTFVLGGDGDDTVSIGSLQPTPGGVLDTIQAYLSVDGGAGDDDLFLDDSGDTTGDIGYVTDTRVSGLGMETDADHDEALPAWSVTVGNAADGDFSIVFGGSFTGTATVQFDAKPKAVQDAIDSILGPGKVTVTRSPVTRGAGITYLIRWVGSLEGAPPSVTVSNVDLTASGTTTLTLTLAQMTDGYVDYAGFESFDLDLGSGDDLVDVDSTHAGTSTVAAGDGHDVLTVETVSGPTTVLGQAGDDSISVNALPGTPTTDNGILAPLTLSGGLGSDHYTVQLFSNGSSRIEVDDDGPTDTDIDTGSNTLVVVGSELADTFLLRDGLVAALNTSVAAPGNQVSFAFAELVTYDNRITAGLVVNTLGGDDLVAMDDNSTITTVNLGAGNDQINIGQMYGEPSMGLDFVDEFEPTYTDTTRGMLTNGVSYPATVNGGDGNDTFQVLRNRAMLQLNGDDGDDSFIVRTFLIEGSPLTDFTSNVNTGAGADVIQYVINAPVAVDGGDGFDTLVLIGTEADDAFVITRDGVWGAGRFVSFVNLERVDIDGAEGDDLFTVISTSPTVQTRVFGGLGSDTITVGTAAPVVVADDLIGHSGLVGHSIETSLVNWQDLPLDGVAAEVTDDEEPAVFVDGVLSGPVLVTEQGTTGGYQVKLSKAPTSEVRITVAVPNLTPEDEDRRARTLEVSSGGTWGTTVTLIFTPENWDEFQNVDVRAAADLTGEGERHVVLQHLVVQDGGDGEYDGLALPNALVRLIDDDQPGVTVVAGQPVRVTEGGGESSYEVSLDQAPTSGTVTVTVTPGAGLEVSTDGLPWAPSITLTFSSADAQTVRVRAVQDGVVEGSQFDSIAHTVAGAGYDDVDAAPVSVLVNDDDTPGVSIIETDGGTHVSEAGDEDSYQVVLNQDPGEAGDTVTVTATALPTWTLNGAAALHDIQVLLSLDGDNWSESVDIVFDGDSWDQAVTVYVMALDDEVGDGSDYQAFAATDGSDKRVHLIQGPLEVYGGDNPEADYNLPAPVMLPDEFSDVPFTTPHPVFDVVEESQVDRLVVDNRNSVSADTGTLTPDRITGLGMGGDRVIAGRSLDGGITYGDLEVLVLLLGRGADTFTVEGTHLGRTELDAGPGADTVTVRTVDGPTRVLGNTGDDDITVGTGLVDALTALLLVDGGEGTDYLLVDDSDETENELGTLTPDTLTGLDMVGRDGLAGLYSVAVHAATGTFTITLDGFGALTFDVGATAAEVEAALQTLMFPGATCGLPAGHPDGVTPDQDSECALSVFVWQYGATYLVGFTGEHAASGGPALNSDQTDLARPDGISYHGLETLDLLMGSGHDGLNLRGTSADTTVDTGAGDDLVFVSDSANLGNVGGTLNAVDLTGLAAYLATAGRDVEELFEDLLHGTVTVDDQTFHGSLDLVRGDLDVDTGAGSNTLAISDHADHDADGGFEITDSAVTGLAEGAIGYTSSDGDLAGQGHWTLAADSGLFGRGISVFLGQGGNTGTIGSVLGGALDSTPYGATVTTVFTGLGDDDVTITADAPAGPARLVVHGQTGDDSIVAAPEASQGLVLFGDAGSDVLGGGVADDLVFGDTGRVYQLLPEHLTEGVEGWDVVFGGDPDDGHLVDPRDPARTVTGDSQFLTVDVTRTDDTSVGTGDTLAGRDGNDILIGGNGADTVNGDTGNDLVFGDFGWVGASSTATFVDATALPLSVPLDLHPFAFVSADTTDTNAGDDTLSGDGGHDILLGQQGADTLFGGDGDDDLVGGHNVAGGHDAGDFIDAGAGHDVVAGDNAQVLRTGSTTTTLVRVLTADGRLYLLDTETGTFYSGNSVTVDAQANPTGVETRWITILDHAVGIDAGLYGDDVVAAGSGNDVVFGQLGDDTIDAGADADYVEGNGGSDTIHGGLGQDDLIGGSSDLFGITDPAMRPDGTDTIYGGDGSATGRSDAGDGSNAADADVLLGDNGRVFRVVGSDGQFLGFVHDLGSSTGEKIIPRVVVLLDYTPTGDDASYSQGGDGALPTPGAGTGTNIGGDDFLHGESGADTIHGMTGDDAIFGDAGDDDLYGESGHDWISGGAGTDGIVGDDGLVRTSRNGSTEQLNGIDVATVQETIGGNGPHHEAVINRTGALNKAADLEPFYIGNNDVMYGGLGDDFLHGGEGDDAISGDEAPSVYYVDDPLALLAAYYLDDDPLQFGATDPEEFLHYDEDLPRTLVTVCAAGSTTDCLPFLLSNDTGDTVVDGNDAVFGDGGNDWLFGGAGADHMYGGWGNDLLDADDDKSTNDGANTDTDPASSGWTDIGFGGAGRDVMNANSGADRLIDWTGEFNSYLVPFNPYGASTIWRSAAPGVVDFLYALSRADGADQTRGDGERQGEPYGELGLVTPEDAVWGDQHGAPDDPQPGNDPGSVDVREAPLDESAGTTAEGTTGEATTAEATTAEATTAEATTATEEPATATVTQDNKQFSTIEVTLAAAADADTVISVQLVDASGVLTTTTMITVTEGGTSADLRLKLGSLTGSEFIATWVLSTDPTRSDLVLVLTQVA